MSSRFALAASLAAALTLLSAAAVTPAAAEEKGSTCSDCPSYQSQFSIENSTGVTIPYKVSWGDEGWDSNSLRSGYTTTHSYKLGHDKNGVVPTPRVKIDYVAGDNQYQKKIYKLQSFPVGYSGYNSNPFKGQPKKYYFAYSADGTILELRER